MSRRKTIHNTGIKGQGSVNYQEVWRVFECTNPNCRCLIKVSEDKIDITSYRHICSECGQEVDNKIIARAPRWKYCRVCENLQPMEQDSHFHHHNKMKCGYQLECKYCKNEKINPKLNPTSCLTL